MINVDDDKILKCGCVLHAGKNHDHVVGCPSVQLERVLKDRDKLCNVIMALRVVLDDVLNMDLNA